MSIDEKFLKEHFLNCQLLMSSLCLIDRNNETSSVRRLLFYHFVFYLGPYVIWLHGHGNMLVEKKLECSSENCMVWGTIKYLVVLYLNFN